MRREREAVCEALTAIIEDADDKLAARLSGALDMYQKARIAAPMRQRRVPVVEHLLEAMEEGLVGFEADREEGLTG